MTPQGMQNKKIQINSAAHIAHQYRQNRSILKTHLKKFTF